MNFLSEQAESELKKEISLTVNAAVKELTQELQPLYLKKFQVCKLLNVSNKTLDELIRLGLPRSKLSTGVIRYNRDKVIEWVNKYHT